MIGNDPWWAWVLVISACILMGWLAGSGRTTSRRRPSKKVQTFEPSKRPAADRPRPAPRSRQAGSEGRVRVRRARISKKRRTS